MLSARNESSPQSMLLYPGISSNMVKNLQEKKETDVLHLGPTLAVGFGGGLTQQGPRALWESTLGLPEMTGTKVHPCSVL